ncbi:helix-turn-helix domain-containing protein [Pantoea sp. Bo_2]|uniref:Helix-turn-helix domain-containing protein n=1 Tax=Candidatus Pantoea gossypiicola TaxID=2608008 RepID=A0AB34CE41_9GAMM|nr:MULTISPECIES: YdaS family helix-turn-helix protein [Pantoea]KAA5923442.1 helix-turn-helix domain-containing protein [Pantoea sp. VH_8]KAA5929186.1 helix-turn-helix domain-containing protein [Pantoea sp. VH_4]KAA5980154.1 helix-turn-helix domain-containing protein [Pantoea sp. M_4]KAA6039303.1 helix-turn-helix domain-containing protein [Pantoea sp. FN_2b]KAA6044170.1 helix-turn-helix domain-containing protein [Pantoea sp. Bo_5]
MNESIRQKITLVISQRGIAKALGITPQAVNQWFIKSTIPPRFVLPLCELVDWMVTPHEVRPDLYPSAKDGLHDRATEFQS